MAMPVTASIAIIIAGGVHAGRVDGDVSRVAVQVRQPFLDRFCAGQALPRSALRAGLSSHRGLQTGRRSMMNVLPAPNAQTDDQFRDPAVALLGMARIGTAAARN